MYPNIHKLFNNQIILLHNNLKMLTMPCRLSILH